VCAHVRVHVHVYVYLYAYVYVYDFSKNWLIFLNLLLEAVPSLFIHFSFKIVCVAILEQHISCPACCVLHVFAMIKVY
jgi:hypothetical protein